MTLNIKVGRSKVDESIDSPAVEDIPLGLSFICPLQMEFESEQGSEYGVGGTTPLLLGLHQDSHLCELHSSRTLITLFSLFSSTDLFFFGFDLNCYVLCLIYLLCMH